MRKVWSNMMLVLPNVTIEPSNVREKKKKEKYVTKVQSHVMLVLHNVRMVLPNVRKKNGTIECDKSEVKCNVGTLM